MNEPARSDLSPTASETRSRARTEDKGAPKPPLPMPLARVLHKLGGGGHLKRLIERSRLLTRLYFEYLYLKDDPYNTRRDEKIERTKRALALLDDRRARNALEVGCGQGTLTGHIEARAHEVVGVDISSQAVARARERFKDKPNVSFEAKDLLAPSFPDRSFDLIVCSEVLYYLPLERLDDVAGRLVSSLEPDGRMLLIHTRSKADDEEGIELKAFGAKTVHERFIDDPALSLEADRYDGLCRVSLLSRA